MVDVQRYVGDSDGSCFAREQIDETAQLQWTVASKRPTSIAGSAATGIGVRDSCGAPPELAPTDWLRQTTCSGALEVVTAGSVVVTRTKKTLVVQRDW